MSIEQSQIIFVIKKLLLQKSCRRALPHFKIQICQFEFDDPVNGKKHAKGAKNKKPQENQYEGTE